MADSNPPPARAPDPLLARPQPTPGPADSPAVSPYTPTHDGLWATVLAHVVGARDLYKKLDPDEKQDIVQKTVFAVMRRVRAKPELAADPGHLYRYSFVAARRAVSAYLKARNEAPERYDLRRHDEEESPEYAAPRSLYEIGEDAEFMDALHKELAALHDRSRLYVIEYLQGFTAEETAARHGVSDKAVEAGRSRGLIQLRITLVRFWDDYCGRMYGKETQS
jgi:RNA polymerase sigma factor (sigma-70 family)